MNESVAITKEVDAKKSFSSTRSSEEGTHRAQNEPERQLGSLGAVIGTIKSDGGTPSAESIATQLSSMHTTQRAPVLLALQQTHGNRYVQRVVTGIQAKLVVGQPGDIYEQEADRVADAVMRMPEPGVQRQVGEEEEELIQPKPLAEQITPLIQRQVEEEEGEELIQTKALSEQITHLVQRQDGEEEEGDETLQSKPLANQITPLVQVQRQEEPEEEEETLQAKPLAEEITPLVQRQVEPEEEEEELQTKATSGRISEVNFNFESHIQSFKGGSQPLSENDRAFFEPRFGYDFSQVRVHRDTHAAESARAVGARAYTIAPNIVFGAEQYAPATTEGGRLLAHELTHVIQQQGSLSRQRHAVAAAGTARYHRASRSDIGPRRTYPRLFAESHVDHYRPE